MVVLVGQVPSAPSTSNLNEWLFLAAVIVLAGAVAVLARYIAQLVRQLTAGQLVARDVVEAEKRLTDVLAQVADALAAAAERERAYMEWLRGR